MIRSSFMALLSGTACILFSIALTGKQALFGSLLGYWAGFGYTLWFYKEVLLSSEMDIQSAIKRMRRNLIARLGMITLIIVFIARFQAGWLFSLALGIVTGVIISFIIVAMQKNYGERGDKRSA
ncbi:ATP synthase I [Desulfosporosinus sp. HMP52]|nr:ATP synthase I [Desulfosporosinus sp. HMP52]